MSHLLLFVLGCEPASSPPAEVPSPEASALPEEAPTADMLKALGYVDAVEGGAAKADGLLLAEAGRFVPGLRVYTSAQMHRADLIDTAGQSLHTWDSGEGNLHATVLLPDGSLLAVGALARRGDVRRAVEGSRRVLRMSWEGELSWDVQVDGHHDIVLDPAGRVAVLDYVYQDTEVPEGEGVRDDGVRILDPDTGAVLARHSFSELTRSRPEIWTPAFTGPFVEVDGRRYRDVFHANSLEFLDGVEAEGELYGSDKVLVCMRHQDAVAILDLGSGQLLWAWGPGEISGPHDASILPNGNVLLFDNGLDRGWSRVLEVDPRTDTIVWQYGAAQGPEHFFTVSRGAVQALPGGHHLVTVSEDSRAFELDEDDQVVWEYRIPLRNAEGERPTTNRFDHYDAAHLVRAVGER